MEAEIHNVSLVCGKLFFVGQEDCEKKKVVPSQLVIERPLIGDIRWIEKKITARRR